MRIISAIRRADTGLLWAQALHWSGRSQVADLLGAESDEIAFTSGGSEANNLALKGVTSALKDKGNHIITTAVEHPAIIGPCRFLEQQGFAVTIVPVDRVGRIDPDDVARAITPRTILISIMHANNEVGTVQPIAEVSRIARAHGVLLHTDAAQSVGKIATDVNALGVDLLTLAGHKVYAPKGVGALYVRGGTPLEPLIHGAGHEGGRRAGTESALLAVGLGIACTLGRDLAPMQQVRALRDRFWQKLQDAFGNRIVLNGQCVDGEHGASSGDYPRPGSVRPRSRVHMTRLGSMRPITARPRIASSAGFHGASVKVSSRRMTASLPIGVVMARS